MDLLALPTPVFTGLDALTQGAAGLCYLSIGLAAWLRAPRDIRMRVFLALSIANLVVFAIPTIWWMRGLTDWSKLPRTAAGALFSGIALIALLLFHFTQVFPRRRPWIRTSGIQMGVAYALTPVVICGLIWFLPDDLADVSAPYILAFLIFGFPLLVLLGVMLPITAIVSLLKSHREVVRDGLHNLRRPIEYILISQIAGGTLAAVFAPVLAVVAPNATLQMALTILIGGLGLLTPFGFAAAVWKYDLLSTSPD